MLICEKCGKLYEDDEIPKHIEHHPYGDGTTDEVVADYECCGQTLEEAVQCDRCGEWYPDNSVDLYRNCDTICRKCFYEMANASDLLKIALKDEQMTEIKIPTVLTYMFTNERIVTCLCKMAKIFVRDCHEGVMRAVEEYADEDRDYFAGELFDLEKERNKQ